MKRCPTIYSIQSRSSLIPVYVGFSYLHFFLCLWIYAFAYLWSHKEVWSARILHSVNFTMWARMLREQRQNTPFSPWFQSWEPQFFSTGREGFLRRGAVCVCLIAALAKVLGLPGHPKHYHLLSCPLALVNFRQLEFKSYWKLVHNYSSEDAYGDFYGPEGCTL